MEQLEGGQRFYLKFVNDVLQERQQKNPGYSMRALARAIDINPGTLHRILRGELEPSDLVMQKMLRHLPMNDEQRRQFILSSLSRRIKTRMMMTMVESAEGIFPLGDDDKQALQGIIDDAADDLMAYFQQRKLANMDA